jgi:glyoxylase-like metal-dependent hydrolase (beta-lactamase superfamily II)
MDNVNAIIPGVLTRIDSRVQRITAPNPGVMTGPGTNGYIIGDNALALIDPGPDIQSHIDALIAAVDGRLKWILCTHTHRDHSPAARALKQATGAQVLGYARVPDDGRQDTEFVPDRALSDGDVVECGDFRLHVVHTPGHASNHLCYLLEAGGLLFTGDHVMQGSTVVISPPDGNMLDYFNSLNKLSNYEILAFAPGHGHVIDKPREEVAKLISHRLKREQKVLHALQLMHPATLEELVPYAYDDVSPKLYAPAQRSLHAHLLKLALEKRAIVAMGRWRLL